jgi:hypothetical protein
MGGDTEYLINETIVVLHAENYIKMGHCTECYMKKGYCTKYYIENWVTALNTISKIGPALNAI